MAQDSFALKNHPRAVHNQLFGSANLHSVSPQLLLQNAELRARASIVGQRKARLLQSVTSDLAESKRLRSSIEGMHMDMGRLNDLIGKSGRSDGVM